jgi:hypothetical protein
VAGNPTSPYLVAPAEAAAFYRSSK